MKVIKTLLLTLPLTVFAQDKIVLTKGNTLVMNQVFTGESVSNLTKQAKDMDATISSTDPIYIVINSPGGSIDAGIELIENLSNMNRPVKTISLFAASMGFHMAQGLSERLLTENGTLMSHKAKGEFGGEFPGQLDSRYGYYLKRILRLDEKVVSRTKGKHTLKSYRDLTENEFWCDGKDCVTEGFADRVVKPSCDNSLAGTQNITLERGIMFGHSVEVVAVMDNCPLNTNPLKYDVLIDGEPLFKAPASTKKWYEWSYVDKVQNTYTNEMIFEITKHANDIILRYKNKEVIKGY